ncbi:TolC family protein [Fibrella aquatilis]|uniref:TolC family protein n=1 Tax=Fibrella aquatilis TaxID=2817059 RepID=A0A939JVI6_9BACT|nr:TolC family protein [Fibrella aquatilis]MBO0930892.1 TolC family protein [Fibrella aquatilis]
MKTSNTNRRRALVLWIAAGWLSLTTLGVATAQIPTTTTGTPATGQSATTGVPSSGAAVSPSGQQPGLQQPAAAGAVAPQTNPTNIQPSTATQQPVNIQQGSTAVPAINSGLAPAQTGLTKNDQPPSGQNFTLQEAINFAVKQNVAVRNSQLDAVSSEARIQEIKSSARPQLSVGGQFQFNPIIQQIVIPAGGFGPPASSTASGGADAVTTVRLSTNFVGNASATFNQLLYDAAYKVGLRAAATLRELSQRNVTASRITVAEQVAKAYYGVLVAQERAKLLDLNISRLDTLLRDTRALNKQGFVEKLDVQRLEVQANNLRADRQNVENLIQLSYALLKFQMGLSVNEEITLTEKLQERNLDELQALIAPDPTFQYSSRIEFTTLQSQIELARFDIEGTQAAYFPRVALFANYGYNNGRNNFVDMLSTKWFNSSAVGLQVSIPIFDGFAKRYKSQQQRITLQKAQNSGELLKNSIDLQIRQSSITLNNGFQTLQTQQRNRDLAAEIVRVTRIKYKEGVGSNIEVLNAETSLREAQTNYFASLYDFLIAKVDQDKALGRLYVGQ